MPIKKIEHSARLSEMPNTINDNFIYLEDMIKEFYKISDVKKIRGVNATEKQIVAPVKNKIVISDKGSFQTLEVKEFSVEKINVSEIDGYVKTSHLYPFHFEVDPVTRSVKIKDSILETTADVLNIIKQDKNFNLSVGGGAGPSEFTMNSSGNTIVSNKSFRKIASGDNNTSIGASSFMELTQGSRMINIGSNNFNLVTSGNDSIIIGDNLNISGVGSINNRFILGMGSNLLFDANLSTGEIKLPNGDSKFKFSSAIKIQSGESIANIFLGNNILPNSLVSRTTSNIMIGNNLGGISTETSNCIFIGNNISATNSNVSYHNTLFIGDLIKGVMNSGDLNSIEFNTSVLKFPTVKAGNSGTILGLNENNELVKLTSSIRYKTNVRSCDPNRDIQVIDKLRPVEYTPLDSYETYYGFIAEEVCEVDRKLVNFITVGDGEVIPDSVSYERVVVPLVNYVKTLSNRIFVLEQMIKNNTY